MPPRQPRQPVQPVQPMINVRSFVPFKSPVVNQKQEGSCKKIAAADMMSLIFRMFGFPEDFVLSPQICVDRVPRNPLELIRMCVHPTRGLERITEYPFSRLPRNVPRWSQDEYENGPFHRYRLQHISYISHKKIMKQKLLDNFAEHGYNYPCVGGMRMMEFADPEVARHHAVGRLPFRHTGPVNAEAEPEHAMLIVGMDTSSDNPLEHHLNVKNSHGESWGDKGYSKIGFEVLTFVCFPVKQTQAELKVQADADAAKARAKAKGKAKDMGKGKEKVEDLKGGASGSAV